MATNTGHVMTLANSIIGVSVLAMPFCFKQCGITLAILMLLLSSITTRVACHFLVKASSMCKRRNFEFLAFYTFGPSGKLLVELGIIGFMMGTCVAFFVVMGDLGPEIISKIFNIKNDSTLRSMVLLGLGLFIVLPLGLLRNIKSLAAISTVTIGFYFLLVIKIFLESFSHLLAGDWIQKVNFWQPQGVLQCIPIFSMALSCQTQIFEIYESLPSPTLDKMNYVVRSAVNICTIVYISVGFLGYIAYCTGNFTGNVLLSFAPSLASELYKLGFVMSIAVSFPLVIFPCRASLYSLIFRRMPIHHELSQTSSYIPDARFKCLTIAIVGVSMSTGLLIPSIELVLGFLGSTIGVAICIIFPALSFINLTNKETNERLTAKVTLLIGLIIMITGSLANFQAATQVRLPVKRLPDINYFPDMKKVLISTESASVLNNKFINVKPVELKNSNMEKPKIEIKPDVIKKPIVDQKIEPPNPVAPVVDIKPSQKSVVSPVVPAEVKKDLEKASKKDDLPKIKQQKFHEENINKDAIEKEEREMKEVEKLKKGEVQKEQAVLEKFKENENEEKLLSEQQKILSAVKNVKSEKLGNDMIKKEEKPVADSGKTVEVKKNVKDNDLYKQDIKKPVELIPNIKPVGEVEKSKTVSKEAPKPKIASVPLPLAKLQVQKNMQNSLEKNNDAVIQSKQEVMGRDILEEAKQSNISLREKRDVEAVKSEECRVQEGKDSAKVKFDLSNKTENYSQETVMANGVNPEDSSPPNNLIKNSQHITVELHLGSEPKLPQENRGVMAGDMVPNKRDLKSMKSKEKKESY